MTEVSKKDSISFEIKNPTLLIFVAFAILILVMEEMVILNRPIAFGDDAYHAYISRYIGENRIFPRILPGLNSYFTYSPMLHLLMSVFYFSSFGEVLVKAFIPILVFLTSIATFVTVSRIFSKKAGFVAGILIATVPVIVTYSVVIYTDILMILFFILSAMTAIFADKFGGKKYWILSALFASLSFLSKGIGVISFAFIGFILLYKLFRKEWSFRQFLKLTLIIACLSILFIGGWLIRNVVFFKAVDCNLPLPSYNCVKAPTDPNLSKKFEGYVVPSGSNTGILQFGLNNVITFMYGNMWLVPMILIMGIVFFLFNREKLGLLALILLLLSITPAIAILAISINSGVEFRTEDAARYLILSSFAVPLVAAVFIDKFSDTVKKYWKYLTVIIIGVIVIFSWYNFKDKLNTMSEVTKFSPLFFDACNFIKSNTNNNSTFLTLWAGPTIYNCERTAWWETNYLPDIVLSNNLTTVLNGLKVTNTDYIFIQKFSLSNKAYQASIPVSFVQFLENNNSTFQKVFENGPTLSDCITQGGCDGTIIYKIKF